MKDTLTSIKEYCNNREECEGCPFMNPGCVLNTLPAKWNINKIVEAIKTIKGTTTEEVNTVCGDTCSGCEQLNSTLVFMDSMVVFHCAKLHKKLNRINAVSETLTPTPNDFIEYGFDENQINWGSR